MEKNDLPRARSVKDFCAHYAVGHTKAYELFKTGAIRTVKVGAKTLVPTEEAERWFASLCDRAA